MTWQSRLLYGGKAETTSGIFRFSGLGRDQLGDHRWSVVLKQARPNGGDDPSRYDYWRREWLVYMHAQTLLPEPGEGLAAPRCYHAGEDADGYWLWLEDVVETIERPWSLPRYAVAASHLATYGGRFLRGRPIPDYAWLARGLLASHAESYGPRWGGSWQASRTASSFDEAGRHSKWSECAGSGMSARPFSRPSVDCRRLPVMATRTIAT